MTAFESYFENMKGKTVAVIGMGVSNTPLIRLLLQAGAQVTVHDKKSAQQLGEAYEEFTKAGAKFALEDAYLTDLHQDYIFRTPGMHPSNPALVQAVEQGSILTSEMEAFFETCPCKIIAITGSDGKTTTTTLTCEILKHAGYTCHLGGNIGKPLLAEVPEMKKEDFAIVELSSFQLMTMPRSADIAAVTNVTPNHLDIHKDMAEYIEAKTHVFSHQKPGSRLVLNADDAVSQDFHANDGVECMWFSMKKPVENGVYLQDGTVYFAKDGKAEPVMQAAEIKIPGAHNVANYMTATALTYGLCSFADVEAVAKNFGGVEHRIELVRTLNGVRYYNDSIASSPTRTIAGLRSFAEKVILIAGGYDKHIPYDVLGPEVVAHVKKLVLVGATAPKIEESVRKAPGFSEDQLPIYTLTDFEEAVCKARDLAQEGDVVILSPASASFDLFPNFMARGKRFKEIVMKF